MEKKTAQKLLEGEIKFDLETLLVAYKIGAITLKEIKRFIKLK